MALPISAASDRSREIYRIPQMCGLYGFRRATACRRASPRWPPCCLSLTFYIWRCICVECLGERMPIEKSDLLQGTLDLLILKIVALGPVHGYGISQRIRQISKEVLQVQQGSLYPALHRLEKRGRRGVADSRDRELGASHVLVEVFPAQACVRRATRFRTALSY